MATAGVLLIGVLLAYSNHFNNGFHFDDDHTIVENLYIRDLRHVPQYFTDAGTFSVIPSNRGYRPLVTLSLAIDYYLGGGLNPVAFHISQFLTLLITGVLLVFLYGALLDLASPHPWNRYAALLAAGLFCIHTANTETVNYIIERSDLLSTAGVIASFLIFIKRPAWRRYQLSLLPMALGALCKPPALMFAPILGVYLILFEADLSGPDLLAWRNRRSLVRCAVQTVPAFVVAAGVWILLNKLQEAASGESITGGNRPFPVWDYLITQTVSIVHYIRLFFWPVGLLADTEQSALTDVFDPRIIGSSLLLCAVAFMAWRLSRRRQTRLVTFGVAWFFLALVPTSSVITLSQVVSEHRIFFPYVGLMLAAAAAVMTWVCARPDRAVRMRRAQQALLCAGVAFVALGVGTYRRNRVWATEETLWRDVTEKDPQNARAWNNYGLLFLRQAQFDQAREMFARSLQLNPWYRVAHVNLGITADRLGDRAEAERHFKEAIRLFEGDPDTHHYYARWLLEQLRFDESVAEAARALEIAPQSVKNRELMMRAYKARGDTERLCALVNESLALLPNDAELLPYRQACTAPGGFDEEAVMNAGLTALYKRDDPAAAAVQFRRVLEHTPTHYGATYQLAITLDRSGQPNEARPLWEKVLEMAGTYNDAKTAGTARARLAKADVASEATTMTAALDTFYKRHDPAAAAAQFRKVLAQNPTHYGATYQLAAALDAAGKPAEARPLWETVLKMAERYDDKPTANTARARLARTP